MVFFLMCEIPSPSLLFAITLRKAGKALVSFPTHMRAFVSLASTIWLFALGGVFFYFPKLKESV